MIAGTAQSADSLIKERSKRFCGWDATAGKEAVRDRRLSRENTYLDTIQKVTLSNQCMPCKRLKCWFVEKYLSLVLDMAFPNLCDLDDRIS